MRVCACVYACMCDEGCVWVRVLGDEVYAMCDV